jgi:hypothetical protein
MEAKERCPSGYKLRQQSALVVSMINDRKLRAIGKDILLDRVAMKIHEDRKVISVY